MIRTLRKTVQFAVMAYSVLFTIDAAAAVIASYDAGATDPAQSPTAQGWSEGGNLAASAGAGAETIGGTTHRYWNISNVYPAASGASRTYRSNFASTSLNDPGGWTATAVLRMESAPPEGQNALFEVASGGSFWSLDLTRTPLAGSQINYISSAGAFVSLGGFDLASDYFVLQMYYDPALNAIQVFVNGAAFGDPVAAASVRTALPSNLFIRWGDNDASPRTYATLSHWNEVLLETGYAVVPEPSPALPLGIAGSLLFLGTLRRKRLCCR